MMKLKNLFKQKTLTPQQKASKEYSRLDTFIFILFIFILKVFNPQFDYADSAQTFHLIFGGVLMAFSFSVMNLIENQEETLCFCRVYSGLTELVGVGIVKMSCAFYALVFSGASIILNEVMFLTSLWAILLLLKIAVSIRKVELAPIYGTEFYN